jgi:hypothetical protein
LTDVRHVLRSNVVWPAGARVQNVGRLHVRLQVRDLMPGLPTAMFCRTTVFVRRPRRKCRWCSRDLVLIDH